ncbi:MAG TPA: DUF72 domain-containing protein [Terriglobales bacterium]|nr:DUF72 domain-containing protein [Terriglobales bacterium]
MGRTYIGTAGFSYKDWQGTFYPRGMKRSQHPLSYYARYFDCCEINTTFYGHLKPEWGKKWSGFVAAECADFQFTAKLNQAFTHAPAAVVQSTSAATIKPHAEDEMLAKQGLNSLAERGRLGALLAQFPISFKNTDANRDYLASLLERFREYPLVVEVRHLSWNDAKVLAGFTEKNVAFCNIDQPTLGRAIRPSQHVTSSIAYVRMHGRNYKEWFEADNRNDRYNYLYTEKEVHSWAGRIAEMQERAEKTFVITNNHYKGQAAANALEIKKLLTGKDVDAPPQLMETYPVLRNYVKNENDLT